MNNLEIKCDRSQNNTKDKGLPTVLYKSANFLCVSKDYDIKINSDNPDEKTTESHLRKMHPELIDPKCKHGFRFVHRLDYATSGILCLALNKIAASHLHSHFKQRNVVKYYLALVRGHVLDSSLYIDVDTGDLQDVEWPGRRCVVNHSLCQKPKPTQTLLVCLEHGSYDHQPVSKVLLKPFTGRQHQLRVHCDYIGHTIVGDFTYSLRQDTKPSRMMLHSYKLSADMAIEKLELTAPDIFTPEIDHLWCPRDIFYTCDEAIQLTESFNLDKSRIKTITVTLQSVTLTTNSNSNLYTNSVKR